MEPNFGSISLGCKFFLSKRPVFECCKDIGHLMVYTGNGFDQDLNLAANAAVASKPKLGLPMGGCWLIFGRLGCWVGTHHALYRKNS